MEKKNAQVTIFVITGFLILFGIIFFIYNKNIQTQKPAELQNPDYEAIDFYIRTCLKNVGEEGLVRIGWFGGRVDLVPTDTRNFQMNPNAPLDFFRYLFRKEPAFVLSMPFSLVSTSLISEVENTYINQIRSYIALGTGREDCIVVGSPTISCPVPFPTQYEVTGIWQCLDDFKPFKAQGWDIEYSPSQADVSVSYYKDRTEFLLNLPITMKKDNKSYKNNKYTAVTYKFSKKTINTISTELGNTFQIITQKLIAAGIDISDPSWISNINSLPVAEPNDVSQYGSSVNGLEGPINSQLYVSLVDDFLPNPVDYSLWTIKDSSTSPEPYYFSFITSLN